MKIHMLYDVQLEGHGAGTTHTMELFENLKKIGNEVYLFVPKPKSTTTYKLPNILYLLMLNIPLLGCTSYQLILFFYYLFYQIKHTKPDAIYVRISPFSQSALILSKLLKIPYIVEINGLWIDEMKLNNNPSKLLIRIYKEVEKINYNYAKKIIAVTQAIKETTKKRYDVSDEKIVVIENGTNIDLFKPMERGRAMEELKLEEASTYICFVGSLSIPQGVAYLIRCANGILEKISNTKFLIVGDGQLKKELVELVEKIGASNKFIFTGAVPYEDVPKYINASEVCVAPKIPLKSGYSPLKLYEYMACGKPVVASNLPGFEILEGNNAGILVEPENPEELAKAILKLLNDKKLREEMGKNGRENVVKYHSWESVARRVAEVCESAVRVHKNKRR